MIFIICLFLFVKSKWKISVQSWAATPTTLVMKKELSFPYLKVEEQKCKLINFLNRNDYKELKNIFTCYKHFKENVTVKTPTRNKLKQSQYQQ